MGGTEEDSDEEAEFGLEYLWCRPVKSMCAVRTANATTRCVSGCQLSPWFQVECADVPRWISVAAHSVCVHERGKGCGSLMTVKRQKIVEDPSLRGLGCANLTAVGTGCPVQKQLESGQIE